MIRQLFSLLPASVRRSVRIQQRFWADLLLGQGRMMVAGPGKRRSFPEQLVVDQPIRPGATLQAKLNNTRKAIALLQELEISSGAILSFWHIVGEPGERQGFLPGRNIVNGRLVEDFGGGLCQLSSAMYELALRTGLEVLERHAHSTNVYTPETSYTTLGLDATLAYGYKDLRIRNNFPFSLCFKFDLCEARLRVILCAPEDLPDLPLRVHHEPSNEGLYAEVYRMKNGSEALITRDLYRVWTAG